MSRFGIERACLDLALDANMQRFHRDPSGYLVAYPLSATESELIERGDIGALYRLDISGGALAELMRCFGYDLVEYVNRLRAALGLPDDEAQLRILRERARRRKKAP